MSHYLVRGLAGKAAKLFTLYEERENIILKLLAFLKMSSAGATEKELLEYRKLEIDYFLAPLQGHSSIQEIAAKQTAIIQPKVVIPHHHDDFFRH